MCDWCKYIGKPQIVNALVCLKWKVFDVFVNVGSKNIVSLNMPTDDIWGFLFATIVGVFFNIFKQVQKLEYVAVFFCYGNSKYVCQGDGAYRE